MAIAQESGHGAVDVIVIGAGFSGLAAAHRLVAAGKSVLVLEARDRVGGKVHDLPITNGGYVELGGTYVGPCQDRILALAEELDIKTYPTYRTGKTTYYNHGKRTIYDAEGPPLSETTKSQYGRAIGQLDSMAQKLDVHKPWEHSDAPQWDSMTLATWMKENLTDTDGYQLVELSVRSLCSAEPEDLSLLQFLAYIARAGNETNKGSFARLTGVENGAQERRIQGGPQTIARRLAQRLGSVVRLRSPVRRIVLRDGLYHVTGETVSAQSRNVVLALPPPLATRITYSPPLPCRRDQLCQRMPMGSLGKAWAIYDTPFWREEGLNGGAIGMTGTTVQVAFDSSPQDGSYGAIMGFLEASQMRQLDSMTESEIQALVVEDYVSFFGPKARDVQQWVIQRWDHEEFSHGGHFAYCPPNVMTQLGSALTERVGNIFFAGAEASPYWAGFMDGAIRAGEIAADQICQDDHKSAKNKL